MSTVTSLGFNITSRWDGSGARAAQRSIASIGSIAQGVGSIVKTSFAVAGVAAANWTKNAISAGLSSNALSQRVRIALGVMLGSAKAADKQLAKLEIFTKKSPFSAEMWLQAQQQMIGFGVQTKKVIPLLGAIQNAVLAGGGTTENIERVVEVMARMASSAEITKGDLNSLGTEGVNAAKLVAQSMGISEAKVRKLLEKGKISVDQFYTAFVKGSEKSFGGISAGVKTTSTGVLDRLKGVQRRIGEILTTPFINPKGGGLFVDLGNSIADALNKLEDALRPLAGSLTDALTPAFNKAGAAIKKFSDGLTTKGIQHFFDQLKNIIPIVGAGGAAAFAAFGRSIAGSIPFLSAFAGGINPISFALVTLVTLSPELRDAFAAILKALAPLLPIAAKLAKTLAEGLMTVLPVIAALLNSVVVPALNILVAVLDKIGPKGIIAAAATYKLLSVLIGFAKASVAAKGLQFTTLELIKYNKATRLAMVGSIKAKVSIVKGWIMMAAQAVKRAAIMAASWVVAMGPVGWVIAGIVALVAVIALNWDRVKKITATVWHAILGFFKKFWPALLIAILGPLGLLIVLIIKNWDKIKKATSAVFGFIGKIVKIFVAGFKAQWKFLWSFLGPLLKRVRIGFKLLGKALVAVGKWIYSNAIKPLMKNFAALWKWINGHLIKPLVKGFKALVRWIYKNLLTPIGRGFKKLAQKLADIGRWINNHVVKPIVRFFKNLWRLVKRWAIDKLVNGFRAMKRKLADVADKIKDKWKALKDTAKNVWRTIKNMVKRPIKWVINTVYNKGIRKFWNKLDNALFDGNHQLGKVNVNGWATGGPVRGRGTGTSDSIVARLSNGEHVLTAREVAAMGGHGAVMALRSAALGGRRVSSGPGHGTGFFAGGFFGPTGNPFDILSWTWDTAKDKIAGLKNKMSSMPGFGFLEGVEKTIRHGMSTVFGRLKEKAKGIFGGGSAAPDYATSGYFSGGLSGTVARWAPTVSAVLRELHLWSSATQALVLRAINKESGGNPNAINLWDINAKNGTPSKGLLQCVPMDTDILTRRGVLKPHEVKVGDETLGYNPATGRNEWTKITKVVYNEPGPIVKIGNKHWQARVTPNHRWWSDTRVKVTQKFTECPECGWKSKSAKHASRGIQVHRMKMHGQTNEPWYETRGEFVRTYAFNDTHRIRVSAPAATEGIVELSVDECAILGWLHGDGHLRKGENQKGSYWDGSIYQSKPAQVLQLRELLSHVEHMESVRQRQDGYLPAHTFNLRRYYVTELVKRAGLEDEDISGFVLRLDPEQRSAWLNAMIAAEGTTEDNFTRIAQCDGPVQDAIKLAVYLEGYRPTFNRSVRYEDHHKPHGMVGMARPHVVPSMFDEPESLGDEANWCVTTEFGSWTMVQDGKFILTGNTIDPTFYRWAGKYSKAGPYNPYANIYAAVRYAKNRYGSGWAARMAAPGGYAAGGAVSYDRGGMLQPGYTLAYNGTGRPEPVGHDLKGGNTYIVNLNGTIMGDRKNIEDAVVRGIKDAKRHGRID